MVLNLMRHVIILLSINILSCLAIHRKSITPHQDLVFFVLYCGIIALFMHASVLVY